jgi:hypothetical protein
MNKRALNNINQSIGKRYGRITIVSGNGVINSESSVIGLCECGNTKSYFLDKLKTGHTKSCGCFNKQSSACRLSSIAKGNKGSNHYLYNPKKTLDERLKRRKLWINDQWRNSVFTRDGFKCRLTGKSGKLNAHHLNSFYSYPLERYSLSNGITLLESVHKKFHKQYGRITTRNQFIEFIKTFN